MEKYNDLKYFDNDCIFCKIINGEIPSKKILENEYVIAFHDISPKASTHILVVTKPHIKDITEADGFLIEKCFLAIQEIAREFDLKNKGFRVVSNCGASVGQSVWHLHFHILSGKIKSF